jgi:hypothetical protein
VILHCDSGPPFSLQLVQDRFMMSLCLIRHQVMNTQGPRVLNLELGSFTSQ